MTAQKAKKLLLEIWQYLAEHPMILLKESLPKYLRNKIKKSESLLPLCEIYKCDECPLAICITEPCLYLEWAFTENEEDSQAAAQKIVTAIEAWEPK